jgi:Flp pilus assembly protein TadG
MHGVNRTRGGQAFGRARRGRARHQGAVAVAFILSVVLLLGIVGLSLDAGRLFIIRSELQNAADACALSAAAALGTSSNALEQAENWGIAAGSRNLSRFQKQAVAFPVNQAVTFSQTLDGTYLSKNDLAQGAVVRYVRCLAVDAGVQPVLMQVLKPLAGTPVRVAASATATTANSRVSCAIPLGICKKTGPGSSGPYGLQVGEWIEGRWEPGEGASGSFKWLQFDVAPTVPDMNELLKGGGQCGIDPSLVTTQEVEVKTGFINSLRDGYNSRFGLYLGGGGGAMSPDFTGHSYWWDDTQTPAKKGNWNPATQGSAFADFVTRRGTYQQVQTEFLVGGWKTVSTSELREYGGNRRLAAAPVIDCAQLPTKTVTVDAWACVFLLHPINNTSSWPIPRLMLLEYRGLANDPGSGCITAGLPGDTSATGPLVPALVQ